MNHSNDSVTIKVETCTLGGNINVLICLFFNTYRVNCIKVIQFKMFEKNILLLP